MSTYVLVHGAWHSGDMLENLAGHIRKEGHVVYCPTLAGNGAGDSKDIGLNEAIASLVGFFEDHKLSDAVLMGHSYGGMVITGAADRLPPGSVRRLIYVSAYVPNDGESLADLTPQTFKDMWEQIKQPDGGLPMLLPVFREALMNDGDAEQAAHWHSKLNAQPYKTFYEKISLSKSPAEMAVGKSYICCQDDLCYPASLGGWHPKFSERLGFFRFLSMPGSHEVCLTNPKLLAERIIMAGRD